MAEGAASIVCVAILTAVTHVCPDPDWLEFLQETLVSESHGSRAASVARTHTLTLASREPAPMPIAPMRVRPVLFAPTRGSSAGAAV
eukprot:360599-Chlamydomonas_euryale.AAC.4